MSIRSVVAEALNRQGVIQMKTLSVLFLLPFLAFFETESFRLPPPPPHLFASRADNENYEIQRIDTMPLMLNADLRKIIDAMINSIPQQKTMNEPIEKVPLVTGKYEKRWEKRRHIKSNNCI